MAVYSSPQAFIRALKGPTDPVYSGGPTKVELARQVWVSDSIYLPNKDEVIVDWILSTLLKGRANPPNTNPICDSLHWSLLAQILDPLPSDFKKRPTKVWLLPLLNRTPILPVVASFLNFTVSVDPLPSHDLTHVFSRCLLALWPVAVQRTNIDILADCFGATLASCSYLSSTNDKNQILSDLTEIIITISMSFRTAFSNATNKKKICTIFLQQHLQQWLLCMSHMSADFLTATTNGTAECSMQSEIYLSGTDIMFSLESLRGFPGFPDIFSQLSTAILALKSHVGGCPSSLLPKIFQSYVYAIRRQRHVLFSSGSHSSQDQILQNKVRDSGMKGFVSCYAILKELGHDQKVWEIVRSLLEALEEANIVSPGMVKEFPTLGDIGNLAADALDEGWNEAYLQKTNLSIQILSSLTRIDFELIAPLIPTVLGHLKTTHQSANQMGQGLLHLLLDYHVKTRTVDAYIRFVLDCLLRPSSSSHGWTIQAMYYTSASSVLLDNPHLEELSKATRGFVTPGQAFDTVRSVFDALKSTWKRLETTKIAVEEKTATGIRKGVALKDIPKKRKRKVEQEPSNTLNASAPGEAAMAMASFSLLSRVAAIVLPSLPLSTLLHPTMTLIHATISDCWREFLGPSLPLGYRSFSQKPPDEIWAAQLASAAALRIHNSVCTMATSRSPLLVMDEMIVEPDEILMLDVVKKPATLSELVVETFRYIFYRRIEYNTILIIDTLLHIICASLKDSVDRSWSGLSSFSLELDCQKEGVYGALALCHLTLDRWAPILDDAATAHQMAMFADLCIALISKTKQSANSGVSGGWIIQRALSSAAFWELPNLRSALLSIIEKETKFLDNFEMSSLLGHVSQGFSGRSPLAKDTLLTSHQIRTLGIAYELLSLSPVDYLPRTIRSDFYRRALVADIAVWASFLNSEELLLHKCQPRIVLRSWLERMTEVFGFVELLADSCDYVSYLITEDCCGSTLSSQFASTSLNLADAAYRHITRLALQGDDTRFMDILTRFCVMYDDEEDLLSDKLQKQSFLRFIGLLISETRDPQHFSALVQKSIAHLCSNIGSVLAMQMVRLVSDEIEQAALVQHSHIIKSWRSYLILLRWLKKSGIARDDFGTALLTRLTTNQQCMKNCGDPASKETFCAEVFALLLEEIHLKKDLLRQAQLELSAAAYVIIQGNLVSEGDVLCDAHLRHACSALSTTDFCHFFALIQDALTTRIQSKHDLCVLIHLSALLSEVAPDGVAKLTQDHIGGCLQIFLSKAIFSRNSVILSLEVLRFVGKQCSERPASVRHLDVGSILSLLSIFLARSDNHDTHTSTAIFHTIISITSALIRLRRDLIISTLPLLSMILRQLLMAMRTMRPQLGARQSQIVTDTLPWWVSPGEPLAADEARALGRLLTALQTKTVVRKYGSAEKRKAESMARPFSKHAPYVLMAYLEAMNDPLCTLSLSVRKELEPGLFSLCSMMTEHSRDAVMASALDAGGKATLKMLWKEYEKQRYMGSG